MSVVAEQRAFRTRHPLEDLRDLCPQSETILDCGAGTGFFAGECDRAFPGATVYSFEPVPELYEQLVQNTKRMLNPRGASRNALTDHDGPVQINLTSYPKSNSLLGFLPGGPLAEALEVVGSATVRGIRLDTWMGVNNVDPAKVGILKMDLQGAELLALDGAPELLKHRPVIYTEVAFQKQYQGQPLIEQMDEYLSARGYVRKFLYASSRPEIWGDAIYVPSDVSCEPLRLNIGAGPTVIEGFVPIDRRFGSEAFPLKYADESVEEIRASHILEHFDFRQVPKALEEWRRVLKPGGRLRISVPDFDKISNTSATDPSWKFYLMGGQTDENDYHRSVFDRDLLTRYLENAGLVSIAPWVSPNTDSAANPISLNLEAFKPGPAAPQSLEIKIKAVMSIPRIGWNDGSQAIENTLRPFGINMCRFNGVFWGQCMQRAFQECLDEGVDWILAIDYDSMTSPKHLNTLLQTFGQHPEIDALAPLQMRRGQDYPLFTQAGKTLLEVTGEPIKAHSAHFGMTLLRVDALKDLPKPWFKSEPDSKGEWGDERLDDDIWFWHQWRLAGKTIYVDPNCRIGHLELMVSEFDDDMHPHHVPISDWWKANGGK